MSGFGDRNYVKCITHKYLFSVTFPAQKHSAVHLSAALRHLHCPQHPFLYTHRRSSLQASVGSGKSVQNNIPLSSVILGPRTNRWIWNFWCCNASCDQQYPA